MSEPTQPHDDEPGRVVRFRHRRSDEVTPPDDLAKFARDGQPDDYRHRMMMNAVTFLVVGGLIAAGLWLVFSIADLRKNQDCALQGRRNCASIEMDRER
jgi:hypothetical protein